MVEHCHLWIWLLQGKSTENLRNLKNFNNLINFQCFVSVTATLASIGAASVPSAGLITMLIILGALDLPAGQISLIYTIDWFLDRLRTAINVWGDALGCGIVAHLSRNEIAELEAKQAIEDSKKKSMAKAHNSKQLHEF